MKKDFIILNVQPNITKTKTFNLSLVCKTNSIVKNNLCFRMNCFDKTLVKEITKTNKIRTKEFSTIVGTKPKHLEKIILFETMIYGFDINDLDIKYEGFIKDNIALILDNINTLYLNFNLKYNSDIKPNVLSIFRILDSLKIIKANNLIIFEDTLLEEFYPEVFELEGVLR